MKKPLLFLASLACLALSLHAAPDPVLDAVRAADDARVSATVGASEEKLGAIFSDDLVYTHSSGAVNHKADYIASIASGKTKYFSIDYESRLPVLPCRVAPGERRVAVPLLAVRPPDARRALGRGGQRLHGSSPLVVKLSRVESVQDKNPLDG